MHSSTVPQATVLDALAGTSSNPIPYDVTANVTGTYWLIPHGQGSNTANAVSFGEINYTGGTYDVLADTYPSSSLLQTLEAGLVEIDVTYDANGDLESSTSNTTYPGAEPPAPPAPPVDMFALGLDIPPTDPGDQVDLVITHADGSSSTHNYNGSDFDSSQINFVLEGVILTDGDTATFNSTEWEAPITGGVSQDVSDGFVWTNDATEILNSSVNALGDTNYTTATTNANGSTTINQTTSDSQGGVTSSSSTVQDNNPDPLSTAEEIAMSESAISQGVAEGTAEGEALYSDKLGDIEAGLEEATDELTTATDGLEDKLSNYNPWDGFTVGTTSTYDINMPLGNWDLQYTIDLQSPAMQTIRAVELFIVSIFAIRFFFRILIV